MKTWLKLFVKDFRRVRWPNGRKTLNYFLMTLIFVSIATAFLFGVDFGFTRLWKAIGLGI